MTLRALRARLRSERGMAIPTVLMLLIVGLGMSSAAIMSTVQSQSSTNRDTRQKQAIAAADAGLDRAVYRENKLVPTSSLPCVVLGAGGAGASLQLSTAGADGWCPAISGTVGSNSYTYRVKPWVQVKLNGHDGRQITVVSTGTSGTISRRISEVAFAPFGKSVFQNEGAIGRDGITVGGSSRFDTNIGTNGNITAGGSSVICGNARVGPSGTITAGYPQCGGQITKSSTDLPVATDLSLPKGSTNDATASRFFAPAKVPGDTSVGTVNWNATTRALSLGAGAILTLGGNNYSICTLSMTAGSQLIMAAGAHSKLFFDTPEACSLSSGAKQIDVKGGATITSTSFVNGDALADLLGFYVAGSDTISTTISILGNASLAGSGVPVGEFVLYAPRSDVSMSGNAGGGQAKFAGQFAGKTLSLGGNAQIANASLVSASDIPIPLLYGRQRYVECTGATGSPNPDSSC
jgi:hypothetical protein